jgi:hypothetical protein
MFKPSFFGSSLGANGSRKGPEAPLMKARASRVHPLPFDDFGAWVERLFASNTVTSCRGTMSGRVQAVQSGGRRNIFLAS